MKRTGTFGALVALVLSMTMLWAASSASATGFVADEYPASVLSAHTATPTFHFGIEAVTCGGQGIEWTGIANGSKTIAPIFGNASCSGGSLKMNGCTFVFHPGNEGNGTVEIGPSGCGALTVNSGGCERSIPAQTGLAATYEETGEGASAKVNVEIDGGIEYINVSGWCSAGKKTNGTYRTNIEISALNQEGEPTGLSLDASAVFLAGEKSAEPSKQPRIESEWLGDGGGHSSSPVFGYQSATSPHSVKLGIRTFTCAKAQSTVPRRKARWPFHPNTRAARPPRGPSRRRSV